MYAQGEEVRRLCVNLRYPIRDEEIETVARIVDRDIDATLSATTYWPYASDGSDLRPSPPPTVVTIANLMTAGLLEQRAFGQLDGTDIRDAGYGAMLYKEGKERLRALAQSGRYVDQAIESPIPVRGRRARDTFDLTGAFRGRRRRET